MNQNLQKVKYILADIVSAAFAWFSFFVYRKSIVYPNILHEWDLIFDDTNLYLGIAVIPLFWIVLYVMIGAYRRVYRKSRIKELGQTAMITLIGGLILFFALMLDDDVVSYKDYYFSLLFFISIHFSLTFLFRLIITTSTVHKIQSRKIGFNTILVGSNGNAKKIYKQIENEKLSSGTRFIGFIHVTERKHFPMDKYLKHLGSKDDLRRLVIDNKVEEVIIAIERSEHEIIEEIITQLFDLSIVIKIIPVLEDFLLGTVKTQSVWHTPLIQLSPELMPVWQMSMKRLLDIVASSIAILLLSPVYIGVAIAVKLDSKGPVLYSQERVGIGGKAFLMHKFRTMIQDAEKEGPQLSSDHDPRITKVGRFMRKVRLDEIPQFFTVLKGDMTLVGPRPERQYFIDLIVKKAPQYRLLQRIKPGITSWGQVKYGYASNVDEMIERLKYDILYLENMSLAMDFKIMIWTVLIIVQGRGK
jgi:exopolysaccharide biosynthesis polyprenyl glycosylphosphotransferase